MSERIARWYGEQRFAIGWTQSKTGDGAKRVVSKGWPTIEPLANGEAGVAVFADRLARHNPVIVLRPSGLIGLDCDTPEGLEEVAELGLPPTLTAQSSLPHKRHLYFRPSAELGELPYVAFRFEEAGVTADSQRYLVCPPAVHPTGAVYAFVDDSGMEIAEMPADTYQRLGTRAKRARRQQQQRLAVEPSAKVPQGQRRDSVFRFASLLRRWHGDDRDAILEHALLWNKHHCEPALSAELVAGQVNGAMKYPGGQAIAPARLPAVRVTCQLLEAVESVLSDYVVVDPNARCALALWVLHTHTFSVEGGELLCASEVTPYMHVKSAAPGCGKSTLFEVLETVVSRPKMVAAGITKASLIRSLHATCPTLLLDEMDLLMKGDKEAATAIHQAINAGYRKRGTAEVLVPTTGGGWEPCSMRVFSPKALAGIGHVPHSLATRTIPIPLRPKMPTESVRDKWEDVIWEETAQLRADLAIWATQNRDQLRAMRDLVMPAELHNRTREIWRPLWAIADLAGGAWPERARRAAVALHTVNAQELDHRVLLLADLRDIFDAAKVDRMHTKQLLAALVDIEEHPWRGWWMDSYTGGLKTEAPHRLAKILKDYGVEPEAHAFPIGSERARGYVRAKLERPWMQYLPLPSVPSVSSVQTTPSGQADRTDSTDCTDTRGLPLVPGSPSSGQTF